MIQAGAACIDITPPPGLDMAGFAARTKPATGTHDPLTVRALAINDTALLIADVIALDGPMSARIRARARIPAARIVLTSLHNHGGPLSVPRSMGGRCDPAYLARLEDACVEALDTAQSRQQPATLAYAAGADPGIARNRRHPGGITDPSLPVLAVTAQSGAPIAHLLAYACHPVVLGADNRLWTADYPHYVRTEIERAHPGTIALFATGCAGEANTGHSAHASLTTAPQPARTFAEAARIGTHIARTALAAPLTPLTGTVRAADTTVPLHFTLRETDLDALAGARVRFFNASPPPASEALLARWHDWAEGLTRAPVPPDSARVARLDWGGLTIAALPGEIFAATAHQIRAALGPRTLIAAYAEACRGYIPPAEEYPHGGYEIEEAHRYYGAPGTYAEGSAERLAEAVIALSPD